MYSLFEWQLLVAYGLGIAPLLSAGAPGGQLQLATQNAYEEYAGIEAVAIAAAAPQTTGREIRSVENSSRDSKAQSIAKFGEGPGRVGPWSWQWTNSIAVCAIMKQENVADVVEWIEHYQWLGVDRILLTENDDVDVSAMHPELQPYVDSGFVEYSVEGQEHAQVTVYGRCIEEHGSEYDWIAFFDIDEFLILREPHQTLKDLLDEYKSFPGLVVHWVIFGSSNRETRPADRGVLQAYTLCENEPKSTFKTIANMVYAAGAYNAHAIYYKAHASPVNEARLPVPYHFQLGGQVKKKCRSQALPSSECPLLPWSFVSPASVERVALFHYVVKSREDFELKKARGGGDVDASKDNAFFDSVNEMASHDGDICAEGSLQAQARLAAAAER